MVSIGVPRARSQRREQVALIAPPRRPDRRIGGFALLAIVPGIVAIGAVAVVLAVGLVVLALVGDEIGEREAVMRDDEVDAARRRAA